MPSMKRRAPAPDPKYDVEPLRTRSRFQRAVWQGPKESPAPSHPFLVTFSYAVGSPVKDLLLFRLLCDASYDDERVPELMAELASLSVRERAPYMGLLSEVLERGPASLHAAALDALAGATGWNAVSLVVRALDAEPTREPALRTLRRAAEHHPARWIHALMHEHAAVRTLAMATPAPRSAQHLELYMLGDEATREVALERLSTLRADDVVPVLDFVQKGTLDPARARQLLTGVNLGPWLVASRSRSEESTALYLASARRPEGPDDALLVRNDDDLDDLFALFAADDEAFDRLFRGTHKQALTSKDASLRVAASLIAILRKLGRVSPLVVLALVRVHPEALIYEWLPREARSAAAHALFACTDDFDRPIEQLQPLLFSTFFLHPDGGPELAHVAALLSRVNRFFYPFITSWLGKNAIANALTARPEESAPFFFCGECECHPDAKRELLALASSNRSRRRILVAFVSGAPLSLFFFLNVCDAADLEHLAQSLVTAHLPSERVAAFSAVASRVLGPVGTFRALTTWRGGTSRDDGENLGLALLLASAKEHPTDEFVKGAAASPILPFILDAIDRHPTFPYGKELALAQALRDSVNLATRAWAEKRLPAATRAAPAKEPKIPTSDLAKHVTAAPLKDLSKYLAPFLEGGVPGVAALVARRTDGIASATIVVALLASPDPSEDTAREIERFASADEAFLDEVESELVDRLSFGKAELSPFGHAWLWRWEAHAYRFGDHVCKLHGTLAAGLSAWSTLAFVPLRERVFAAAAHWLALLGSRDPARFHAAIGPALTEELVLALPRPEGPWAADAIMVLWRQRRDAYARGRRLGIDVDVHTIDAALSALVAKVRLLLPDLSQAVRERLAQLIDSDGLPLPEARVTRLPVAEDVLAKIRSSSDLDELERLCRGDDVSLVHEAALRLLLLGEDGRARLASCLETIPTADQARPIIESLALWDDGLALGRARACMTNASRSVEFQFRIALSLLERGEVACFDAALERALVPFEGKSWFEGRDWQRLVDRASEKTVARALATSPHARAYLRAVEVLLGRDEGVECLAALRAFLETGTTRLGSLRRTVAFHLLSRGEPCGFPLCVQQELDLDKGPSTLFSSVPGRLVEVATRGFLAAGNALAKETSLLIHLSATGIDPAVLEAATAVVLTEATVDAVRQKAANRLHANPFGMRRMLKLHRVADTFAWGVRKGAELLGRKYKVEMTGGASLGHTRLRESRIFVTPLPILKNERFGREIVEGLILHELGHHMYHRGKEAEAIWDKAQKEGLHGLLNLVADEHLERNLRAVESGYGDRLKRLAAFAFQHTSREIDLSRLLGHLGGRAFEVLHTTRLGVGKDEASVAIDSGELLGNMERSALAFSRFVRALRMGLGNRHDDARVARALELFPSTFRHLDMKGLMDITYQLRDIFGWETELVESFGPHESLETGGSEEAIWGDGITAEEIEREVQRVLDPKTQTDAGESGKPGGPPWINIAPTADFERINVVQPLAVDPVLQAELAARVQRPANLMRRFFDELGLSRVPQRLRMSGHRLDKSRVKPLVLRGDPRALIARQTENKTDLFLGITVDCSGSMAARDNMDRARLFAALLAEASRGLRGIDFRAFGFTDKIIYDAGDANRCAAHALIPGGGNNDAAALFHLANVAKASRRRAKVLVMISDGLPTECSVAALRELVATLTSRERMVCAQAAVQPLAEVCFPHYVLLSDPSIEITVRKFGTVIARLVQRALNGS